MNRLQFLKKLKSELYDVVAEVATPIIENKLEKLDEVTDILEGTKWIEVPATKIHDTNWHAKEVWHDKRAFFVISQLDEKRAFSKMCPECGGALDLTKFDRKFKCFICDKSTSAETFIGELNILELVMQKRNGKWYVKNY